jgi:hypothetical protein
MSAVATRSGPDECVQELYGRYKRLALAAGASLVLDTPCEQLTQETSGLLDDARAALADHPSRKDQLAACVEAAQTLHALLVGGGFEVEAVRATHKRLRREVWKVVPCEYVPCCASPQHAHDHGGENDG